MPDRDSNGVDTLDRFLAYKCRFMQFSVTEDVFHQVVEHIKELRSERDEARREVLLWVKERCSWAELSQEIKQRGWEYLKEDGK
jgi:hypothetical protein